MQQTWDVIVVGAGPAGSSAARVISQAGFSVLVLDKKERIGDPNHCGEGVSANCLAEAGVTGPQPWIIKQVDGCKLLFPNQTEIRFTQKGYCIDRPSFDRFLAARALDAGAVFMTSTVVSGIISERSGWVLTTNKGTFRSRYLIGAGGALCPVARYHGQRAPILPALQYKFRKKDVALDFSDGFLQFHHHEDFSGGYAWVFDRGSGEEGEEGEVSIGAGSPRALKEKLDSFCIRMGVDPSRKFKAEGGPIPFLKRPLRIAFPRALLAGDSGGFTYPFTKGGVHGAVWSARIAGEVIVDALRENESYLLSDYTRRVSLYPCRSRTHLLIPQAFFKFDNPIIETIGNIMDKKEYTEIPVGRFLKYFLSKPTPRILWGIAIGFAVQRFYHRSSDFAW